MPQRKPPPFCETFPENLGRSLCEYACGVLRDRMGTGIPLVTFEIPEHLSGTRVTDTFERLALGLESGLRVGSSGT